MRGDARAGIGLALGLWLIACVVFLVRADKPWTLDPEDARWQADTVRGLWLGAAVNAVLAAGLLATLWWWAAPLSLADGEPTVRRAGGRRARRLFWAGVGAAVVVAGAARWNLAHRSLWWDELWNVKQAIVGSFRADSDDPPGTAKEFRPTDWKRCAWYYQKPTNHVPAALAAKASVTLWQRAGGHEAHEFTDFAVRLPTFLASLAAVVAAAWILGSRGFAGAGVAAAFLLALHPWHIRYGIDTRAYSWLVLWMLLGTLALTRLLEPPSRWRHWLLFALVQFLTVWSLPNAFWYAGGFAATAAAWILARFPRVDRLPAFARLVAVNLLAAMAFFAVAGPNVVQAARWVGTLHEPVYIDAASLLNASCQLAFGTEWRWPATEEAEGLAFVMQRPAVFAMAALVLAVAAVIGVARLARADGRLLVALGAVVASAVVYLVATHVRVEHFYHRYLIYLLVPFTLLVAVGVSRHPLLLGAAAGTWLFAVAPQIGVLTSRPYAPLRDVAERLRAAEGDPILLGFGLGGRILETYEPGVEFLLGPPGREQLDAVVARARAEGRGLLVWSGYSAFNHLLIPTIYERLEDPALFREIAAFPGIEPEFHFRILEYTGAPLPTPPPPDTPPGEAPPSLD